MPTFARGDGSPGRAVEPTGILDLGLPTGGTVRDGVACRSDDALANANAPGAWALVLGSIVLRHIEAARGMILIGRLLDRVAEDGVAVLQAGVTRPNNAALRRLRHHVRRRGSRPSTATFGAGAGRP